MNQKAIDSLWGYGNSPKRHEENWQVQRSLQDPQTSGLSLKKTVYYKKIEKIEKKSSQAKTLTISSLSCYNDTDSIYENLMLLHWIYAYLLN